MAKNNTTSEVESNNKEQEAKKVSSLSESKKTSKEIADNLSNPENEFMKKCNDKIKKIDEKIKEIDAEWEKKLKMIPKMDDTFTENMCLNDLSEILSDDEIAMVKEWRDNDDLRKIYEETWSYRDNLAKKVLTWLENIDKDKKLIFARYLSKQRIICCGDSYYNFWFYYTDIRESRCDETKHTIQQLWLGEYVKYVWDSCYNIDSKYVDAAKKKLFEMTLSDDTIKAKEEFKQLKEKSESLENQKDDILKQKEAVEKYWLPVERAVSIFEWENGIDRPKDKKFDIENNTYVILSDYSYYPWYWGMEYWVIINIKRWSNTQELKIPYRSNDWDDWSKDYNKIKNIRVEWDKVFVTVSSKERSQTYKFNIKDNTRNEHLLNSKEQSEFKKRLEEETKKLIDKNTKHDQKYPAIHNFTLRKTPWSFGTEWLHPYNTELPYDQAEIVDEYVNLSKWIAYIVIKAQIDSSGDMWKQFAWIKYEITPKSTTEIERENLRELLIVEGKKSSLRAKD